MNSSIQSQRHSYTWGRKAFGKEPPSKAGIGIMNDSDDTGESSVSYIELIEIFRKE